MATTTSSRVVMNRKALSGLQLAVADGLLELGEAIVETAAPKWPDDPSTSPRISETGAVGVWVGSKKVGGTADKPRRARMRRGAVVTMLAGFGSPLAHIFERGTASRVTEAGRETGRIEARHVLMRAMTEAVPETAPRVGAAIRRRLGGRP